MTFRFLDTRRETYTSNLINSAAFPKSFSPKSTFKEREQGNIVEKLLLGSGIGIWVFELKSGKISFCPVAKNYFSIAADSEPTLHDIFQVLKKGQRVALIKMFENICASAGEIDDEIKIYDADDKPIWLKITGKLYGDLPNQVTNLLAGTIVDITKQKIEEQKKEDCIALLSHELRSPLSTVRLYLQKTIGLEKSNNSLVQVEMLKKADIQINYMLRLMDTLLDVSIVSNTQLELMCERFNMIRLIREVMNEMQLKYPWNNFVLEFDKQVFVKADKDKIVQVLINYMSNAVKYSAENSTVTVGCKKINGKVIVSVKDQGLGITPADQSKLFKRYSRTSNSAKKGCGLGLYLVKEIIRLHKGDVWVESLPGEGSEFYFSLPAIASS